MIFWIWNLLGILSNDPTCDTHVPNQLLLICNHMMHICKKPHFFVHPTIKHMLYVGLTSHNYHFFLDKVWHVMHHSCQCWLKCVVCSWTVILPGLGNIAWQSQKINSETTDVYIYILLVQTTKAIVNLSYE